MIDKQDYTGGSTANSNKKQNKNNNAITVKKDNKVQETLNNIPKTQSEFATYMANAQGKSINDYTKSLTTDAIIETLGKETGLDKVNNFVSNAVNKFEQSDLGKTLIGYTQQQSKNDIGLADAANQAYEANNERKKNERLKENDSLINNASDDDIKYYQSSIDTKGGVDDVITELEAQIKANNALISTYKYNNSDILNNSYNANNDAVISGLEKTNKDLEKKIRLGKAITENSYYSYLQEKGTDEEKKEYDGVLASADDSVLTRLGKGLEQNVAKLIGLPITTVETFNDASTRMQVENELESTQQLYDSGKINDEQYTALNEYWNNKLEEVSIKSDESFTKAMNDYVTSSNSKIFYNTNDIEQFILQAGMSTEQFVTHFLAFGPFATATMGLVSFSDQYNTLINETNKDGTPVYDADTVFKSSMVHGLVSYLTEKIGMDNFVNNVLAYGGTDVLGHVVNSVITQGLSEGGEEIIEGLVDPVIDSYLTGEELKIDGNELLMSFLLGATSGAFMAVGGATYSAINVKVQTKSEYNKVMSEVNYLKNLRPKLTANLQSLADSIIEKGTVAADLYKSNSITTDSIVLSSEMVKETSMAQDAKTMIQSVQPDFNTEAAIEQRINQSKQTIYETTQNMVNRLGVDMSASMWLDLSNEKREEAVKINDWANKLKVKLRYDFLTNDGKMMDGQYGNTTDEIIINPYSDMRSYRIDENGNAVLDENGNKIFSGRTMTSTFVHEFVHSLEGTSEYDKLANLVKNENYDSDMEKLRKAGISENVINQEYVAIRLQDMLGDGKFIDDLANNNLTLFRKIHSKLNDMFKTVPTDELAKIKESMEKAYNERLNRQVKYQIEASSGITLDEYRPDGTKKDLLALHNVTEDKLNKIIDIGGLVVPSIAVTNQYSGNFAYGPISLVLDKESINPAKKDNRIYAGDAWTGVFPRVEYKVDYDKLSNVRDSLEKYGDIDRLRLLDNNNLLYRIQNGSELNRALEEYNTNGKNIESEAINNDALKYYFLESSGKNVDIAQKEEPINLHSSYLKGKDASLYVINELRNNGFSEDTYDNTVGTDAINQYIDIAKNAIASFYNNKYGKIKSGMYGTELVKGFDNYDGRTLLREVSNYLYKVNKYGTLMVDDGEVTKANLEEAIKEYGPTFQEDYNNWVKDNIVGKIEYKTGIRNDKEMFTPNGNPRSFESLHDEVTLENVLKYIKKLSGNDSRGVHTSVFGISAGDTFATALKPLKSINDIIENEGRIRDLSDDDFYVKYQECVDELHKINANVYSIFSNNEKNNSVEGAVYRSNNTSDFIKECFKCETKEKMDRMYKKEFEPWEGLRINETDRETIFNNILKLKEDVRNLPVRYFESKPMRIVSLNEIKQAIVPDDISEETINKLKSQNYNVEIVKYNAKDTNERLRVTNEATNQYKFSSGITLEQDTESDDGAYDKLFENIMLNLTADELNELIRSDIEDSKNKLSEYQEVMAEQKEANIKNVLTNLERKLGGTPKGFVRTEIENTPISAYDADYDEAVKTNDEARAEYDLLAKAYKLGYQLAYHGTDADFNVIDSSKTVHGKRYGEGFYMSAKKGYVIDYGKKTLFLLYKLNNPFIVDKEFRNPEQVLNEFLPGHWADANVRKLGINYIEDKLSSETGFDSILNLMADDMKMDVDEMLRAKGYDGLITKDGNQIVVFPTGVNEEGKSTYNNVKLSTPFLKDDNGNVIPLSERLNNGTNDIRYSSGMSLEDDDKYGYHYGAKEIDYNKKSETLGTRRNRGTGALGTGTYFFGNKQEYSKYGYNDGKKTEHKVNFDDYNMFKIKNYNDGYDLHEYFKTLDDYFDYEGIKTERELENKFRSYENVADSIEENGLSADGLNSLVSDLTSVIGKHKTENIINSSLDEDTRKSNDWSMFQDGDVYDFKNNRTVPNDELLSIINVDKLARQIRKVSYNYSEQMDAFDALYESSKIEDKKYHIADILGTDIGTFENALYSAISSAKEDYDIGSLESDSLGTRLMKNLGYEGIDVRGIEGLDNSRYGSVIYDLKPESVLYSSGITFDSNGHVLPIDALVASANDNGANFDVNNNDDYDVLAKANDICYHGGASDYINLTNVPREKQDISADTMGKVLAKYFENGMRAKDIPWSQVTKEAYELDNNVPYENLKYPTADDERFRGKNDVYGERPLNLTYSNNMTVDEEDKFNNLKQKFIRSLNEITYDDSYNDAANKFMNEVIETGKVTEETYNTLKGQFYEATKGEADGAYSTDEIKSVRKWIKASKINTSDFAYGDRIKKTYGDFGDGTSFREFAKDNMGTFTFVKNGGDGIDVIYRDFNDRFPGLVDSTETSPYNQVMNIKNAIETMKQTRKEETMSKKDADNAFESIVDQCFEEVSTLNKEVKKRLEWEQSDLYDDTPLTDIMVGSKKNPQPFVKNYNSQKSALNDEVDKDGILRYKKLLKGDSWFEKTTGDKEVDAAGDFVYNIIKDAEAGIPLENLVSDWVQSEAMDGTTLPKDFMLAQYLYDIGEYDLYQDVFQKLRTDRSKSGQILESNKRIYEMTSPVSKELFIDDVQDNMQAEIDAKYGKGKYKVDFTPFIPDIISATSKLDLKQKANAAINNVLNSLNLPNTLSDKIFGWRYLAMLSRPATWIRNFVSNEVNTGLYKANNLVRAIVEDAIIKSNARPTIYGKDNAVNIAGNNKTATLKLDNNKSKANRKVAANYYDSLPENQKSKYEHTTFKKGVLGWWSNVEQKMLSDENCKRRYFIYQMDMTAQARGIDLTKENINKTYVQDIAKYAYDQAEEVVSHNETVLGDVLNNIKKYSSQGMRKTDSTVGDAINSILAKVKDNANKGYTGSKVVDSIARNFVKTFVPFTTTNAALMKKKIELAPGLNIPGLVNAYDNARIKGTPEAAQVFVDKLSKAFTGASLYMAAAALACCGLLRYERDDEDYNGQTVLYIGEIGIPLDFLDPGSNTVARGTMIAQELMERGFTVEAIEEILRDKYSLLTEDEMDMFSSVTDLIRNAGYVVEGENTYGEYGADDFATDEAYTFLSSFIPGVLRDVSRLIDNTKKNTYDEDNLKYLGNRLINNIPVARGTLPTKTDAFGNDQLYAENLTGNQLIDSIITTLNPTHFVNKSGANNTYTEDTGTSNMSQESQAYYNQLAEKYQFTDENGDGYNDSGAWLRTAPPSTIYFKDDKSVTLSGEDKAKYSKEWSDMWTAGGESLMNNDIFKSMSEDDQANVLYNLQLMATRQIGSEIGNDDELTNAQLIAKGIKGFVYSDGKVDGEKLAIIALAKAKAYRQTDENGETVKNSNALGVRNAYEEAGIYDEVIDYIESNGLDYDDFGLNKTVVGYSDEKAEEKSEEITNNPKNGKTGNAESKIDEAKLTTKVSAPESNTTTAAAKTTNAALDLLTDFKDIYANLMNTANDKIAVTDNKTSAEGSKLVKCPKCKQIVTPVNDRCPVCHKSL